MKKKFHFFDSDALKNFHKRIFFSITIFIIVYFVAFYRILDVMIFEKSVDVINNNNQIIQRGNIYDRNGNLLSSTIKSYALSVKTKSLKDDDKNILSEKLSLVISEPKEELLNLFNKKSDFVWIKRSISPKEHQQIIDLGEVALQTQHKPSEEQKRIYPYGHVAAHVIGYINTDGIGQSGIERGMDETLNKGIDIHLSIDVNLQAAVRKELQTIIEKYSANSGFSIVMDITNGEIISMNSFPDFNPNNRKTFKDNNRFNRIIAGNYEMGSVFKPITVAMGIDKGIINPGMFFDVSKSVKGVKDHTPFNGKYNVKEIVVNSSNIGAAQIASKIGKKNQKEFFKRIGFDKKINFEINETAEPLGNKNNWGDHETMRIGFGYGYSITPLHLVSGYASLINDGKKINPTLLKNKNHKNDIQIVKSDTSSYFVKLLRAVVLETKITGNKVKVEGYQVGGKTGTANILNKFGVYEDGKNLTSFIAVFPTSKPKYIVLTSIENPKKTKEMKYKLTGATVAAPLVKKIILRMIEILSISAPTSHEVLKADISSNYQLTNDATF